MDPRLFPPRGDGISYAYRARAQEPGPTAKGCAALAEAESRLDEEEFEEALNLGKQALESLRQTGGGPQAIADAARLACKALIGLGRREEASKLAQEELRAARTSGDRLAEATLLLTLADAKSGLRGAANHGEAIRAAQEAEAMFHDLQSSKMAGLAAISLSWAHICQDEEDEDVRGARAEAEAKRARAHCRDCARGDATAAVFEAAALHALASAQALRGELDDCLRSADEALDIYLGLRLQRMAIFEWLCMSRWNLDNRCPGKALSDAEDAWELCRMLGSPREPAALLAIHKAHLAEGKPGRARRVVKEALARFEDAGDKQSQAATLDVLFQVLTSMGRHKDALAAANAAVAIWRELGDAAAAGRQLGAVAAFQAGLGAHEKAVEAGSSALPAVMEAGSTDDKVALMRALAESHVALGHFQSASQVVRDMLRAFEEGEDDEGSAAAHVAQCRLALKQDLLDEAARAATSAHAVYSQLGDGQGEADALRLLCDVLARKEDYKAALRTAERARQLCREIDDQAGEAVATYLLAQSAVQLAVKEGARGGDSGRASRAAREALAKAQKAAPQAVSQAREIREPGAVPLLACALCTLSQVEMLYGQPEDALKASDEGVVLFRDAGDDPSEASALLLSADALRAMTSYRESHEAASEALRLFAACGDERGQERAQELLDFLREVLRPTTQLAHVPAAAAPVAPLQMVDHTRDVPAAHAQAVSLARQDRRGGPPGAALDLRAGVTEETVRVKVLDIAMRITGAEDGEIESDTPLMEAGLTSQSAILMRDELAAELPGVNLPVTLVFDYPSIAAMTELIVESTMKALRS